MKIWWGFRLAIDASILWFIWSHFATAPTLFYRFGKMEPIRRLHRRRPYMLNPYFSDSSLWKVAYDKSFRPIQQA